jgi:hypothetical protein
VSGDKVNSCICLFFISRIGYTDLILRNSWCINLQVEKNVFIVFYSGERAKNKILKLCEAFGANRYPFMEDLNKQFQIISQVQTMIAHVSYLWFLWIRSLAHWKLITWSILESKRLFLCFFLRILFIILSVSSFLPSAH